MKNHQGKNMKKIHIKSKRSYPHKKEKQIEKGKKKMSIVSDLSFKITLTN